MTPKILDILPKKRPVGTCVNNKRCVGPNFSYNIAIDEVTESLKKNDVCVCPNEKDLAKVISEYCNKNSLLYDGCKGLAKAIRKLIMEGV